MSTGQSYQAAKQQQKNNINLKVLCLIWLQYPISLSAKMTQARVFFMYKSWWQEKNTAIERKTSTSLACAALLRHNLGFAACVCLFCFHLIQITRLYIEDKLRGQVHQGWFWLRNLRSMFVCQGPEVMGYNSKHNQHEKVFCQEEETAKSISEGQKPLMRGTTLPSSNWRYFQCQLLKAAVWRLAPWWVLH